MLLTSFGLVAAGDARSAVELAKRTGEPRACCCCALAEAPGAVIAKLCCSLGCGKQGQGTTPAPSSGDVSTLTSPTQPACVPPVAGEPTEADRIAVLIAATERRGLERSIVPLYVTNATFLI